MLRDKHVVASFPSVGRGQLLAGWADVKCHAVDRRQSLRAKNVPSAWADLSNTLMCGLIARSFMSQPSISDDLQAQSAPMRSEECSRRSPVGSIAGEDECPVPRPRGRAAASAAVVGAARADCIHDNGNLKLGRPRTHNWVPTQPQVTTLLLTLACQAPRLL